MTEVKICGLKTPDMVDSAIEAGAAYVGFVMFPKSPRHVEIETAAKLCAHAQGRAQTVALLVNPNDAQLDNLLARANPDIIQLHGNEPPERVAQIKSRNATRTIWKAVPVATLEDVAAARRYDDIADLILFDAKPPSDPDALPGGNGLSFDWRILNDTNAGAQAKRPFALAGGLTPQNVADAIELVRPGIVDVSSGVESAPGLKDQQLIQSFIRAAKTAKQEE